MMKIYCFLLSFLMVVPLYAAAPEEPGAPASRCPRRIACSDREAKGAATFFGLSTLMVLAGLMGYAVGNGFASPTRGITVAPCGPCQSVYSVNICQSSDQAADNLALSDIKTLCKNQNPVIFDTGIFPSESSCISLADVTAQFISQCPTNATGLNLQPTPQDQIRGKRKLLAARRAGRVI